MILDVLVPVFFVMALGYLAGRRGTVDNGDVSSLNTTLMAFALPASLFLALARTGREQIVAHGRVVLAILLGLLVVYGVVYLLQRTLFGTPRERAAANTLTVSFPNFASIGLPLASGVYGSVLGGEAGLVASLCIAVGAVTVSPLTLALMAPQDAGSAGGAGAGIRRFGVALGGAVRKPIVLGPVLGLVVALAGIPLPGWVLGSFSLVGSATAALGLFLTGLVLSANAFRFTPAVGLGVLVTNVAQPALVFGVVTLLGVPGPTGLLVALLFAIPCGFFGIVLGLGRGVRSPEAGSTLIASSVLGVATLALAIGLFGPA